MGMKANIKATISSENYLKNKMSEANQPQTDDKLNEFLDCFAQLH